MKAAVNLEKTAVFVSQGKRQHQEDFALADRQKQVMVVADGFGGPLAGAYASKHASESVLEFLAKQAGDLEATLPFEIKSFYSLAGNVLFNALIHANRALFSFNKDKKIYERGGASVAAAFIHQGTLALANVGSSSAWLFREGQMEELVRPRSYARLIQPLIQDPARGLDIPLMALGVHKELEPEIVEVEVQPGDWVLLQSDGLTADARREMLLGQSKGSLALDEVLARLGELSFDDNSSCSLGIF